MGIFSIENFMKLIETKAVDVCEILETRRAGLSIQIVYLPFLAAVFMTTPITLFDFGVLALCLVILMTLEETRKHIQKKCFSKLKNNSD